MKNNMRILSAKNQERRQGGFFKPLIFGSIALFLCMEVSEGACARTGGGIGVCVDNREISEMLGIKWNGVEGKTDIYKPLGPGSQTIRNLTFKFSNTPKTRDAMTVRHGSQDFTATVSGTSLEINGNGKRGLQIDDDGGGTLFFALENNKNKQVKLDLGSHGSENTQHALKGNLVVDGDSSNGVLSNFFGTLSNYILPSGSDEIVFSGFFGGKGILGDLSLGLFDNIDLTFGDSASIEGKITLEAGKTKIQSTDKTFLLTKGIYSGMGEGTLIFKDTQVNISGFLSSEGKANGDCAIISNGGIITIHFDQEEQNIAIKGVISTVNKPQSNIVVKTTGERTLLTLNGVNSDNGTSGVNIRLEGKNSTLVLNKKAPDFNFQGSGNIITNINGYGSKVEGDVSFNGSGKNEMFFQENGTVNGDIIIESPQVYDAENRVTFKQGGDINGCIHALSGKNIITFESGISQIGGLEVKGQNEATNTINLINGDLTINANRIDGDSAKNSLYVQNPNGSNIINVNGTLTINGSIGASAGINQIVAQEKAFLILGDSMSSTIYSQGGTNVLSLNNGGNNELNLKTIEAISGENFLGKDLIAQTNLIKTKKAEDLKNTNMFTGAMQVSQGVSAKDGKNTILFIADSSQEFPIIQNIDESDSSIFTLKDAIYGNNDIVLDISETDIPSIEETIQNYYKSPQTILDQKELGRKSAILGNIASGGGENFLLIVGYDSSNHITDSALFGNILTDNGSNNLVFQNAIVMPSKIILKKDQSNTIIGGNLSGNFVTMGGKANIVMSTHSNSFENKILVYNLDAQGGETNLFFEGNLDIEIDVKQNENSKVNLSFSLPENQIPSFTNDEKLGELKNKILKLDLENGFKVELVNKQKNTSEVKVRSTHKTNSHSLLLDGTIFGIIRASSQLPQQQNIILSKKAIFVGDIKSNSAKVEMEDNSKIFFQNFGDENPKGNFSLPTLQINGKNLRPTLQDPKTIIDIMSESGNSFKLLTIGNTDSNNQQSKSSAGTGLQGSNGAEFMVRVNPKANQENATLGGEGKDKKGYIYSDRIIVANIGDNSKAQEGYYYLGIHLDNDKTVTDIRYDPSKDSGTDQGGSKQEGNVAVLTVVNTGDQRAGIDLKIRDTVDGFDQIGGGLTAKTTDINGVYNEKGGFTTYFLDSLTTNGPTNERNEVSASALVVNYDLHIITMNSLNKRMGELRDNPYSQGVWARIFGGAQSNDFGLGTKTSYVTLQAGYDYAFGFEGANNYLGLALSYSTSSSAVQNSLTQDLNHEVVGFEGVKSYGIEVALYNAYVQDEGWYNDSIFKFSYITSSFTILNQTPNYSTHNIAFTLSDEFGYRFKLGEEKEWFIDPQFELTFGYFNQSELKQTLGDAWLNSIADALFTLRSRFGSSFGYDFKKFTEHKSIKASVYVGAFYEYDYVVGGDVFSVTNIGGESKSSSVISSDGRVVLNVGTNMIIKDNTRLYFDFEKSFAGKITTDYQINVGVRYSFGENMGYMPVDPNKKSTAPLKIRDESESEVDEEANHENEEGNKGEHNESRDGAKEERKKGA